MDPSEIEREWARDEQRIVERLAELDPSWGSTTFELGDGIAVLAGPGLFTNRVLALGLTSPVDPADLDRLEAAAAQVGVPAAVEVSELSDADLAPQLAARGYEPDGVVTALVRPLDVPIDPPPADISMHVAELAGWQLAAAEGWGHDDAAGRRASDVYAAAAFDVEAPGLVVARAGDDDRIVGCAALRVSGLLATLGGMSTLPAERRRGVQSAMILHRLTAAAGAGCTLAASMAQSGGDSERNLRRHGFEPSHTKTTWTRR